MTEREFRQNGENQSGRDGRKSYNNREGYNRNETIVMRVEVTDVVLTMDLKVVSNVRTALRSTLVLTTIIMVLTASSVEVMAITIMAVSNVLMAIAHMETMKEENVLTAHHVLITTAVNVSSVSLLLDLTMMVVNSVHSVLVRDSRVDIVSRVADMVTTVREVSVSVPTTITRMQNIA